MTEEERPKMMQMCVKHLCGPGGQKRTAPGVMKSGLRTRSSEMMQPPETKSSL